MSANLFTLSMICLVAVTAVNVSSCEGWTYGPVQKPECAETVTPSKLPQERADTGIRYRYPSGWHLTLENGFKLVETLPAETAYLYYDNLCMMALDGGSRNPRLLYQPRLKNSCIRAATWSPDGRYCYAFFDCTIQLVRIETETGKMSLVTNLPVRRNYKGSPHFEPIIQFPFAFDSDGKRLLTFEQDYGAPYNAQLISIGLPDGKRKVLSAKLDLGNYLGSWAVSTTEMRIYTRVRYEDFVRVWDFEGKQIDTIHGHVLFNRKLLKKGETPLALGEETDIPEGICFRASPNGKRLSFLRRSEEAWLYDMEGKKTERLANLEPRQDATDWSRAAYFTASQWSEDGNFLAMHLSSYGGPNRGQDSVTLLFDLLNKKAVLLPIRAYMGSWSPVPKPFPTGLKR